MKIGKILELVPSSDDEMRKVKVESEGHVSLQAVVNLRKIESDNDPAPVTDTELGEVSVNDIMMNGESSSSAFERPPRRAAALCAQQKWLGQFLVTVE